MKLVRNTSDARSAEFWSRVKLAADILRDAPVWEMAGITLNGEHFETGDGMQNCAAQGIDHARVVQDDDIANLEAELQRIDDDYFASERRLSLAVHREARRSPSRRAEAPAWVITRRGILFAHGSDRTAVDAACQIASEVYARCNWRKAKLESSTNQRVRLSWGSSRTLVVYRCEMAWPSVKVRVYMDGHPAVTRFVAWPVIDAVCQSLSAERAGLER